MRILHISTRLILGGSQENTVLSCEGQVRRGHEVHLAFGPIYGPEGSLLERVEKFRVGDMAGSREPASKRAGERGKIHTHVIPNLVREINPIKDRRALRELIELIERLKPDIVHTHSSKAGILGRWAAWGSSTGVVHTIHGPPFMPIEGSPLYRLKVRALNFAYTIAERSAAKYCHTIVSVADAMTREFLLRGIGTPNQYVTVRSGMELEPYLTPRLNERGMLETRENVREALGLKPDDFVIGTVARLAQHKGHDDVLEAIVEELQTNPNFVLLWVGDGWWRDRLVSKVRSLGLAVRTLDAQQSDDDSTGDREEGTEASRHQGIKAGRVVLTGLVPPERIPGLLRAMDLLAHPSYREGLPRTVPQALLCGVPVVAYDCDGTGEVCRDMDTGRLVKTGDTQALGEAIRWMADHPDDRRAMAERGKAMCLLEFSAEKMVDDLERVYANALKLAARLTSPVLLAIVIPVYNERTWVRAAVERVLATPPMSGSHERRILLIDDGSIDGTAPIVHELGRLPGVTAIKHDRNQGKGAALRTGFKAALDADADIILVHDADMEYDPADHADVLAPILDGRADMVVGSRFLGQTHRVLYYWHFVANRFITTLCNMATNLNLTDIECCSKAFTRDALSKITIEEDRFGVEPELIAKAASARLPTKTGASDTRPLRIYEVPVSYAGRTFEEGKKITWRDGISALRCIVKYGLLR